MSWCQSSFSALPPASPPSCVYVSVYWNTCSSRIHPALFYSILGLTLFNLLLPVCFKVTFSVKSSLPTGPHQHLGKFYFIQHFSPYCKVLGCYWMYPPLSSWSLPTAPELPAPQSPSRVTCGPSCMTIFILDFWLVSSNLLENLVLFLFVSYRLDQVIAFRHMYHDSCVSCSVSWSCSAVLHILKFFCSFSTYLYYHFRNCLYQSEFLVIDSEDWVWPIWANKEV